MTEIYTPEEILDLDLPEEILAAVEKALVAHAAGGVVSPPVGYLPLERPRGDVHIKYGYLEDGVVFVIKVASGVYEAWGPGTPASHGLMMIFDRRTTAAKSILLDDGHLTALRTGAAGAIAARALTPPTLTAIGIVGTGRQAGEQARFLRHTVECRRVLVWGRRKARAEDAATRIRNLGFEVEATLDIGELLAHCELVVTATASEAALFEAGQVRPGTHFTAIGADAPGKQELPPELFERAAIVAVDSIEQAADHGDSSHAVGAGHVAREDLVALGALLSGAHRYERRAEDVTIADLTGIAAQDVAIATLYAQRLQGGRRGA